METSYKEKYEQALAKAKEQYNYPCMRSCMGILEEIFPELAESEDEKVRKELIKHLKEGAEGYEPAGGSSDYKRWLTWVEKQEENNGNIGGISPKWSVEDEENFCSVYLDVKSARQNTVNSLSGELKEQEQKRMDEVISWLRSLKGRVLPKQEWNEEDEQHIDSLLKRLDALCRNKFERTRFAISEDRDWLKSLRPQNRWKPSDEQIIALKHAFTDGSITFAEMEILATLYEGLKSII